MYYILKISNIHYSSVLQALQHDDESLRTRAIATLFSPYLLSEAPNRVWLNSQLGDEDGLMLFCRYEQRQAWCPAQMKKQNLEMITSSEESLFMPKFIALTVAKLVGLNIRHYDENSQRTYASVLSIDENTNKFIDGAQAFFASVFTMQHDLEAYAQQVESALQSNEDPNPNTLRNIAAIPSISAAWRVEASALLSRMGIDASTQDKILSRLWWRLTKDSLESTRVSVLNALNAELGWGESRIGLNANVNANGLSLDLNGVALPAFVQQTGYPYNPQQGYDVELHLTQLMLTVFNLHICPFDPSIAVYNGDMPGYNEKRSGSATILSRLSDTLVDYDLQCRDVSCDDLRQGLVAKWLTSKQNSGSGALQILQLSGNSAKLDTLALASAWRIFMVRCVMQTSTDNLNTSYEAAVGHSLPYRMKSFGSERLSLQKNKNSDVLDSRLFKSLTLLLSGLVLPSVHHEHVMLKLMAKRAKIEKQNELRPEVAVSEASSAVSQAFTIAPNGRQRKFSAMSGRASSRAPSIRSSRMGGIGRAGRARTVVPSSRNVNGLSRKPVGFGRASGRQSRNVNVLSGNITVRNRKSKSRARTLAAQSVASSSRSSRVKNKHFTEYDFLKYFEKNCRLAPQENLTNWLNSRESELRKNSSLHTPDHMILACEPIGSSDIQNSLLVLAVRALELSIVKAILTGGYQKAFKTPAGTKQLELAFDIAIDLIKKKGPDFAQSQGQQFPRMDYVNQQQFLAIDEKERKLAHSEFDEYHNMLPILQLITIQWNKWFPSRACFEDLSLPTGYLNQSNFRIYESTSAQHGEKKRSSKITKPNLAKIHGGAPAGETKRIGDSSTDNTGFNP